mmetsp:Transcript_29284/g.72307  ORF Transcript_29284/g.72307 Transcript_29284/m.72307 type:complete len:204 (+) Transcript_29284:1013-1624(+)
MARRTTLQDFVSLSGKLMEVCSSSDRARRATSCRAETALPTKTKRASRAPQARTARRKRASSASARRALQAISRKATEATRVSPALHRRTTPRTARCLRAIALSAQGAAERRAWRMRTNQSANAPHAPLEVSAGTPCIKCQSLTSQTSSPFAMFALLGRDAMESRCRHTQASTTAWGLGGSPRGLFQASASSISRSAHLGLVW